jgi:hypothetical protein
LALFESTLRLPSMIAALSAATLVLTSAGTCESRSWNGAMSMPLFASVPTYGAEAYLPSTPSLTVS